MAITNLSWTATTEESWIHVDPSEGTGNADIRITADDAQSAQDPVSGVVVFTTELSDGTEKTIELTVYRCGFDCSCGNITLIDVRTEPLPQTGTNNTYIDLCKIEVEGGCVDSVSFEVEEEGDWIEISSTTVDNIISILGKFGANTSLSTKAVTVYATFDNERCDNKYARFEQTGRGCGCDEFELVPTAHTKSISCNAGSYTITNAYMITACTSEQPPTITASTSESWITNVRVSASTNSVSFNVSDNCTSPSARTGSIIFSVNGSLCDDPNNVISITQESGYTCGCQDVSIVSSSTTESWVYNATDRRKILEVSGLCDGWSVSASTPNWMSFSSNTKNNGNVEIYIWPNSECTTGCTNRNGSVVCNIMSGNTVECSNVLTTAVEQDCSQVIIISGKTSIDCSGETGVTFTIQPQN